MSPKNRRIASSLPNRRRGVPEKDCCTGLVSQIEENTPRKIFATIEEASTEVTRVIRQLNSEGVLSGIQDLPKRWEAVIRRNGDSIEGL